MLGGDFRHALLQRETALERSRLVRRPGTDLAAAGAGGEIGIGLLRSQSAHLPAAPPLATQRLPVKQQRRLGLCPQVLDLATESLSVAVVAIAVKALQEHHAQRRRA